MNKENEIENKFKCDFDANGIFVSEDEDALAKFFINKSYSQDDAKENFEMFSDSVYTKRKCGKTPSQLFDMFYSESTKNDLQAEKIIELKKEIINLNKTLYDINSIMWEIHLGGEYTSDYAEKIQELLEKWAEKN